MHQRQLSNYSVKTKEVFYLKAKLLNKIAVMFQTAFNLQYLHFHIRTFFSKQFCQIKFGG